jgi:hypothetical protein
MIAIMTNQGTLHTHTRKIVCATENSSTSDNNNMNYAIIDNAQSVGTHSFFQKMVCYYGVKEN